MTAFLVAFTTAQPHADQISFDRSLVVIVSVVAIALVVLLASQVLAARRTARELIRISNEQLLIARREAQVALAEWKQREEEAIRQDAIRRSQSVIVGKVTEHMVPFLPDFPWNPKDARFIGSPLDFLVFDGLDEGRLREILFVEVKTASSPLSTREKQIREAVEGRRIGWREIRIDHAVPQPVSTAAPQLPAASLLRRGFFK